MRGWDLFKEKLPAVDVVVSLAGSLFAVFDLKSERGASFSD